MSLFLADATKVLKQACFSEFFWKNSPLLLDSFLSSIPPLTQPALLDWLRHRCDFSSTSVLIRAANPPSRSRAKCYEEVMDAITSESSIQILHFQKHLGPQDALAPVLAALQGETGVPIHAVTLFLTPKGQQTLPIHKDDVDVITLQLSGSKCWEFWEGFESGVMLEYCREVSPRKLTVREGGLLYLPKNLPHRVIAGDETSVSMGLIFRRHTLKDLINQVFARGELAQFLARELRTGAETADTETSIRLWQKLMEMLRSLPEQEVLSAFECLAFCRKSSVGNEQKGVSDHVK